MSSKTKNIIEYFAKNDASEPTKRKVWQLMTARRNNTDADAAYKELWDDSETAHIDNTDVAKAYTRFNKALGAVNKRGSSLSSWGLRIAAVLIPLLVITTTIAFIHIGKQAEKNSKVVMLRQSTALNDSAKIILPDGSLVRLQEGSMLLYPSSFENNRREVYLVGKAVFEVHHNETNPLKIVTPYFEISDLGTTFSISSYPEAEESSAIVSSGKIALRVSGKSKTYNMSPNDMLIYNVSTGRVFTGKSKELSQRWKRRQVNLDDISFAEAVKILSKNYGVAIDIHNHKFDAMHVTVHFNKGETLENTMKVIASLLPNMNYEINGQKVIIK